MLSVTVDSNIYISAFKFGGTPLRLLRLAVEGKLEIAISQPIMDEILRVLREKFGDSPERLSEVEAWMRFDTKISRNTGVNRARKTCDSVIPNPRFYPIRYR